MSAAELLDAGSRASTGSTGTPRRLVVTWQHPERRSICPVGFLTFDGDAYGFHYVRAALTTADFSPLIGFPDLHEAYTSAELFPLFAQRAMDPRRADYTRYVTRLGLPEDTTPWEQIARSGGRRNGDTLQLFPEPQVVGGSMSCTFLAHGLRHICQGPLRTADGPVYVSGEDLETALGRLQIGEELAVLPEPNNQFNANALLVTAQGTPVGWIPNLLVDDLARLRQSSTLRAFVERVNGSDAPGHLRLLGTLRAENVGDFEFFTSDAWEPIAQ
ncbi:MULTISPECIES: hypothetical protein [unclassified Nocardioides]|uniref:hypothetical protein n=1 Tax=unclassified Nocardioides TaxID=2615069 RepID=UPI000AFB39C0|nr:MULTISPECIES: hypothetical protein [unclassified Nocardioides]